MKIGFIGLGNMAGTICQGLIKSDLLMVVRYMDMI